MLANNGIIFEKFIIVAYINATNSINACRLLLMGYVTLLAICINNAHMAWCVP